MVFARGTTAMTLGPLSVRRKDGATSLTHDLQMSVATSRMIDRSTGGTAAGCQFDAVSCIIVTIPSLDPRASVRSGAVEGDIGGVHEIFIVHVGQVHAETTTHMLCLAMRNVRIHDDQIATRVGAYV
jgi:hypothetical protein